MRIYKRSEFMKLPPGTLFSAVRDECFEELCVKEGVLEDSYFYYRRLVDIDWHCSIERPKMLERMDLGGASYPINGSFQREGLFDEEMRYLVYEKEDLKSLDAAIKRALSLYE